MGRARLHPGMIHPGHLPMLAVYDGSGQRPACLGSLVTYAQEISRTPRASTFRTLQEVIDWIWAQPVRLDEGDGRQLGGCSPSQRSNVWPSDGLNCWEATAHVLGWLLREQAPLEVHVYDAPVNGQRHVFPALRELGEQRPPEPLVLQPPLRTGATRLGMAQGMRAQGAGRGGCLGRAQGALEELEAVPWYVWLDPTGISAAKHISDRAKGEAAKGRAEAAKKVADSKAKAEQAEAERLEGIKAAAAERLAKRREQERREQAEQRREEQQAAARRAAEEAQRAAAHAEYLKRQEQERQDWARRAAVPVATVPAPASTPAASTPAASTPAGPEVLPPPSMAELRAALDAGEVQIGPQFDGSEIVMGELGPVYLSPDQAAALNYARRAQCIDPVFIAPLPRAQGVGNDIAGWFHVAGDTTLRAFNMGGLADRVAGAWGDIVPDSYRTPEQVEQRRAAAAGAAQAKADEKALAAQHQAEQREREAQERVAAAEQRIRDAETRVAEARATAAERAAERGEVLQPLPDVLYVPDVSPRRRRRRG